MSGCSGARSGRLTGSDRPRFRDVGAAGLLLRSAMQRSGGFRSSLLLLLVAAVEAVRALSSP